MHIRRATLDDLAPLALLFDAYRIFYEKESDVAAATGFLAERINRGDSVIYVAAGASALAGFVQLYPLFSSTRLASLWLLNDLYVDPAFRGQKLSVRLIDAAKQLAVETHAAGLALETAKGNAIGNALYARTGFALDIHHNYYAWTA